MFHFPIICVLDAITILRIILFFWTLVWNIEISSTWCKVLHPTVYWKCIDEHSKTYPINIRSLIIAQYKKKNSAHLTIQNKLTNWIAVWKQELSNHRGLYFPLGSDLFSVYLMMLQKRNLSVIHSFIRVFTYSHFLISAVLCENRTVYTYRTEITASTLPIRPISIFLIRFLMKYQRNKWIIIILLNQWYHSSYQKG